MKSIKLIFSLIVSTFLIAGISSAKETGLYIGGGFSSLSQNQKVSNADELDFTTVSFHLGYKINERFSTEGTLFFSGIEETKVGSITNENIVLGLDLDFIANYEVVENTKILGLIGYGRHSNLTKEKDDDSDYDEDDTISDSGIRYGFGVQYDINDKINIRAVYSITGVDFNDSLDNVSDLKFAMSYNF